MPSCHNPTNNTKQNKTKQNNLVGVVSLSVKKTHHTREEQDLLEILDLKLFGVKTLVSILIEVSLATFILLDSCLVRRIFLKILLDSCSVRNRFLKSRLILA
jgi:hypothetical protein